MAKIGYIFLADAYETVDADKEWMHTFGCMKIVEEKAEDEKLRPEWKALLMNLERGDELVISKFSNALRGSRELAFFLELCRIKVIRVISINDQIDSRDVVFSPKRTSEFLEIIGSLPAEVSTLRKASSHIVRLQSTKPKTKAILSRQERETTIVNMYNGGHSIDDIWSISGFKSRSSIFRILKKYGIALNRGPHSGPIKKWSERKKPIIKGNSDEKNNT